MLNTNLQQKKSMLKNNFVQTSADDMEKHKEKLF